MFAFSLCIYSWTTLAVNFGSKYYCKNVLMPLLVHMELNHYCIWIFGI